MLSKIQKELLSFGYTRLNYDKSMPDDIIILFTEWINNALYVSICGDMMDVFLSTKHDEAMDKSYMLQLSDDMSLECTLYPNGYDTHLDVLWKLKAITKEESKIFEMCFYTEGGCEEIPNSIYKETALIYDNNGYFTMPMISYSRCKNKEELTFYINAELIRYNINGYSWKNGITKYFIESPIYSSHIEYEWIIENDELDEFKNCDEGQMVFSPNFANGCCSIFVTPKGDKMDVTDDLDLTLGIEFYKIPNKVKYLSANIELKTNVKDENGEYLQCKLTENHIGASYGAHVDYTKFTIKMFENLSEKLVFNVIIDIIQVCINENGTFIDKSEWREYGIDTS